MVIQNKVILNKKIDTPKFKKLFRTKFLKKYKDKIDKRDLIPYTFPDVEELKVINYHSAALGNYIPWDYKKNTDLIVKELGWKVGETEGVPKDINISAILKTNQ